MKENTKVTDPCPEPTHFFFGQHILHGLQAPLTYSETVFLWSEQCFENLVGDSI